MVKRNTKHSNYREVGLEREFFLLRKDTNEIVEPIEYEFPSDVFGFLVELRSRPWVHLNTVKMTWDMEKSYWEHRAKKFGMKLVDIPYTIVPYKQGKYYYNKYGGDKYEDLTKNVYSENKDKQSHHLGMFFDEDKDECMLTSGMHVHFSIRDENCNVIPFTNDQIELIVKHMDLKFYDIIQASKRRFGEYEPKKHGFEYRSLPCNADVYRVLEEAFFILRNI